MIKIDACGLSCPEPVYLLKRGLKEDNEVVLLVDNRVSVENCSRYAEMNGYAVSVNTNNTVHELTIKKV